MRVFRSILLNGTAFALAAGETSPVCIKAYCTRLPLMLAGSVQNGTCHERTTSALDRCRNVCVPTARVPIIVGSKRASSPAAYAKNIRITGNSIQALSAPCIQAFSVSGLNISDNKWSLGSAASADAVPLSRKNIVNETVSGNSRQ